MFFNLYRPCITTDAGYSNVRLISALSQRQIFCLNIKHGGQTIVNKIIIYRLVFSLLYKLIEYKKNVTKLGFLTQK